MYQIDEKTQISKNFTAKEFACKDGSFLMPDYRLVELLQKIRDKFGKSVTIISAYRSPKYNKRIGGAPKSQHLYAKACDISIEGVSPLDIAKYAETLLNGSGGVGWYPESGFTHVDVRENRSRWKEEKGKQIAVERF